MLAMRKMRDETSTILTLSYTFMDNRFSITCLVVFFQNKECILKKGGNKSDYRNGVTTHTMDIGARTRIRRM